MFIIIIMIRTEANVISNQCQGLKQVLQKVIIPQQFFDTKVFPDKLTYIRSSTGHHKNTEGYSVQCSMYKVQGTVYKKVYNVHCTGYSKVYITKKKLSPNCVN